MLLKNLHCLNKVPKSSHLHSLNLALNVVINLVAKLFFSVENMFFFWANWKWVTKQRRLLCRSFQNKVRRLLSFSWHGQRFLQYSMIFCDSMFSSLQCCKKILLKISPCKIVTSQVLPCHIWLIGTSQKATGLPIGWRLVHLSSGLMKTTCPSHGGARSW